MSTSYNGWPASQNKAALGVARLIVGGVEFVGGVKDGDVLTVLGHVAAQIHQRVEALRTPGCWGWAYRKNRNSDNLSCHSSATAIDCNAPQHPNGIEAAKNFTKGQIAEIHEILAEIPELAEVVHWGGDWHAKDGLTPDPMHFEIHDHDLAKLARVAKRIKGAAVKPPTKPSRPSNWSKVRSELLAALNSPEAKEIPATRPVVRAFITLTRRRLTQLPKS